ncbi:MAG TPA: hypothetical protein VGX78_03005 [Pirellulales bacterium]|nr:hypothetical protein [Pirellulales bacterium]
MTFEFATALRILILLWGTGKDCDTSLTGGRPADKSVLEDWFALAYGLSQSTPDHGILEKTKDSPDVRPRRARFGGPGGTISLAPRIVHLLPGPARLRFPSRRGAWGMITGKDYLHLAETWVQGPTEGEWRSAVSRAYYGVFHLARQLLRDLGFVVPRADQTHAYLWLRLSNCGHPQVRLAGSDLNTLRRERNRADYELERTFGHDDALLQVKASHRVSQILDGATAEPTRTQIRDASRAYERDVLKQETCQA